MRSNWLVQGLVSNWLSSAILVAGATILATLGRLQSPWLYPVLYALTGASLILACILMLRILYGARPTVVEPRIRNWLDQIGASTKKVLLPEFSFCYEVLFNNRLILVAQPLKDPRYVDIHVNIDFAEKDNERLADVPGGLDGIVRGMRLFLAVMKIGYSGITVPLRRVCLSKRLLITAGFNEEKFVDAFFSAEAATNLVATIASVQPEPKKPSQ